MTRAGLVGSALIVIACGVLAACTSTSEAASSANSRSATPLPLGAGNVHVTDYADNDGMTSRVILTGAVGDYGSAKRDDGKAQLDLDLSRGTFRLDIADLDGRLLARIRHLGVNQRSCSAEAAASGRVPIVPGSGTGAYSTVRGTFDLTMTLDEVYHSGACRETAPYVAQQIITTGWGRISQA